MYYFGTITGEEENKDHDYSQAALCGAVIEGHLGLLEGLASLGPSKLDLLLLLKETLQSECLWQQDLTLTLQ